MEKTFYGRNLEFLGSDKTIGLNVTLVDLAKSPDLNGKYGVVTDKFNARARFPVKVPCLGKVVAVKPSNLLFHFEHDIFFPLRDADASSFEWEQARHNFTQEAALRADLPEIIIIFFQRLLRDETAIKFDQFNPWNGWCSVLAAFTGRFNPANPGHPSECEPKSAILLVEKGCISTWLEICFKFLNVEGAVENSKILLRIICQFTTSSEVIEYVLKIMDVGLYSKLLDFAENVKEGATQSLALTALGNMVEWAKILETRKDLVNAFKMRSNLEADESEIGMLWVAYEMLILPMVKKTLSRGRPFGSHQVEEVYDVIDENMKEYESGL